jgi:hypothetical protein
VAEAVLRNDEARTLDLNLAPLASPSLALEVVDAQGAPVLLPPPGVPGGAAERATVRAGGTHSLDYPGFIPSWIDPGRYRARVRTAYRPTTARADEWTGELVSDWVDFEVRT